MIEHSTSTRGTSLKIMKVINSPGKNNKNKKRVYLQDLNKIEYDIDLPSNEAEALDLETVYLATLERVCAADFPGDDPRKQGACTQYERLITLRDNKGKIIYEEIPTMIKDCLTLLDGSLEPEQKARIKTLDDRAIKEDLDLGIKVRSIFRLWNNNARSDYFRAQGIEDVQDMSDSLLRIY